MTHSPADILSSLLISQGVFADPGDSSPEWGLYLSFMPDEGDDEIGAIYDTEGVKDGRTMSDGKNVMHPGFQIAVRSQDPRDGFAKLKEVQALLEAVVRVGISIEGTDYTIQAVSQISPIFAVGQEEGSKRRHLHTANFLCTIMEEAGLPPDIVIPSESIIIPHASDIAIAGAQLRGQYHTNAGAGSTAVRVSLPQAAEGLRGWFIQIDSGQFIIDLPADNHFEGTLGTFADGQALILNSPVSKLFILADGINKRWILTDEGGSFTAEE